MRSSPMALQESLDVEGAHDHGGASAFAACEQLAVAARDMKQRHAHQRSYAPVHGQRAMRRQVSVFERKFSCVVIAPFGKPVVPLV